MTRKPNSGTSDWLARSAVITAVFAVGIAMGLMLWGRITLPFHNPWHVVGAVTLESYNPANNYLRFLALLSMPLVLLVIIYYAFPGKLKDRLFLNRSSVTGQTPCKMSILPLTILLLIAILAALNEFTEIAWNDLDAFHEGESLATCISYLHGQAPYKDFAIAHGMFNDPLRSVVAFKLSGRSVGAVRAVQSGVKVIEFVLLAISVMLIFEANWLWVFTALALFAVPVFLTLMNEDSEPWYLCQFAVRDIMVFAYLAATMAFKNRISKGRISRLSVVAGGFLCAFIPMATMGYSVDRGTYLLIACIIFSLILYVIYLRKSHYSRCYLASSALGILAGVLLVNTLTRGNLAALITDSLVIEPRYFGLFSSLPFPIYLLPWKATLLLLAADTYWMALAFVKAYHSSGTKAGDALRCFTDTHFGELALLVLSLLVFSSALYRCDWPHMATGAVLPYLLASVILARHYFPRMPLRIRKPYPGLLAIGMLAWSAYGISCIFSEGLIAKNFPIRVSDSELVPDRFWGTVEFLKSNLAQDETFFTLTSEGIWYYLLDKPCPTRFPLAYMAATDFYQREVVEDLKRKKVKYIIYENDYWSNNIDGIPTTRRLPIVDQYIMDKYEPVPMIDDNKICVLKEKSR
jgi:hypothetical protein